MNEKIILQPTNISKALVSNNGPDDKPKGNPAGNEILGSSTEKQEEHKVSDTGALPYEEVYVRKWTGPQIKAWI